VNAIVNSGRHHALALGERVIPAAAFVALSEAQGIVEQANDAVARLDADLQLERERAREAGRIEGRQAALDQFAAALAALQESRARLDEQMRAQLGELAVGVVERIAPALGAERLVSVLVAEAVRQLAFEPTLLVCVHPSIADAIRQHLTDEGLGIGTAPIEIIGKPELGEFDCVIEIEGGVVRAGLGEQLEQVRIILAVAQQKAARDNTQPIEGETNDAAA
jgi:flagellar biosynthesis/type III secretory pathway protein FliH